MDNMDLPDWLIEEWAAEGLCPPGHAAQPASLPVPPGEPQLTMEDLLGMIANLSERVHNLERKREKEQTKRLNTRNWRDDPIATPGGGQPCKQFMTLTRLLRQKDWSQIEDPGLAAMAKRVAVYHDISHVWPELPNLTKGEASDLIEALIQAPGTNSSPVETVHR